MLWMSLGLLVALPLVLIGWVLVDRSSNRLSWLLLVVAAGAYLVVIALAGLWLAVPRAALLLLVVSYLTAVFAGASRFRHRPALPRGARALVAVTVRIALTVLAVTLAARASLARRAPEDALELEFPLRDGIYVVVSGGLSNLVNAHLMTLSEPHFRDYRGQSYGVDVVEVNRWGVRAPGAQPSDPTVYRIFGDSVYAPCAGMVVTAEDGYADMPPPMRDRAHIAGNHVILECDGDWIVLGHFQRGSAVVDEGQIVTTRQLLGRVGNSGNTDEPHLHIHAQSPGTAAAPLSGDPIAIRFGDRLLVRNSRVVYP
jgi:hypothetical protein